MEPMKPMEPLKPMAPMDFGPAWWPAELGEPSTSGAQNGARYAVFPERSRLLVEKNGKLTTYDTGEHQIGGVSQGNGYAESLIFTSQSGAVTLDELRRLDSSGPVADTRQG